MCKYYVTQLHWQWGLAHGLVTFAAEPLQIEVLCSPEGANRLPEKRVSAALAPTTEEQAP